jgi:hypothetical protein
LIKGSNNPREIKEFQRLEHNFTELADNGDWMANNLNKTVQSEDAFGTVTPAEEEAHILRCLGASVIMQWNTLPTKLQKELFDNASSVGELLQTSAFRQQMARFLHKHKNNEAGLKT